MPLACYASWFGRVVGVVRQADVANSKKFEGFTKVVTVMDGKVENTCNVVLESLKSSHVH